MIGAHGRGAHRYPFWTVGAEISVPKHCSHCVLQSRFVLHPKMSSCVFPIFPSHVTCARCGAAARDSFGKISAPGFWGKFVLALKLVKRTLKKHSFAMIVQ